MLRPGTKLPSPATVSRDVKMMYEVGAEVVREYFSVCHFQFANIFVLTGWNRNTVVLSI